MGQKEGESRDIIDLDDDVEFDDDLDEDAGGEIDQIVSRHVQKATAEMNRVLQKMESRFADHENRIENLEKIVTNTATASAKRSTAVQETEATGLDRFLDVTLGTTGRALHAVVDTMAFVGESAVDIVTLGRARVNRQ